MTAGAAFVNLYGTKTTDLGSPPARKDLSQLLRRHHLQLRIRTILRPLVRPPSPEVSHVPKPPSLHMFIGDLRHKLRSQRLPRQILPLTPPALPTRHALPFIFGLKLCPAPPRMSIQRTPAIGLQKIHQFSPLRLRKACAHPHVLQRALRIEQPQ